LAKSAAKTLASFSSARRSRQSATFATNRAYRGARALWVGFRPKTPEIALTCAIEDYLSHDRARRVSGAQEKDVDFFKAIFGTAKFSAFCSFRLARTRSLPRLSLLVDGKARDDRRSNHLQGS
jgi:hypothetical protein